MNDPAEIAPDRPEFTPSALPFPVVGVGASAGGLEAFESFLHNVDPEFEAAYVLVQHLDPTHESMLTELLERHTRLKVVQITDGTAIHSGHFYIIPAASGITIEDGVLGLVDFEAPRGFRRPIDDFFQALAIDQGSNAAAIVLSGTGGDGTVGIRHIKEAGGLAIVQDPSEAAYDGMPSSAIGTGLVDAVLPIREMADAIGAFFRIQAEHTGTNASDRADFIAEVITAVREQTGHDFSYYKTNTVLRRIQRRMQVLNLVRPADYIEALRHQNGEADALFQDLLINVTSFFRDPETFDYLRREVIPQVLRSALADRPLRIWVPACSSGEEAYSIAILLAEGIARMKDKPDVQIFATDIDEEMLDRARAAVYMPSVVSDLPPDLVNRYFFATEEGFALVPMIRDMVRVSAHSLIKDPPFSRLDLISCRNLLIYFNNQLQSRVLPLFHYALRPDGWLVLGSAENIGGRDDLFATVAREERVYRKLQRVDSNFVLPLTTRTREPANRTAGDRPERGSRELRDEREARVNRRVMERYAMPHVLVDGSGRVVHASARTAPFLHLAIGAPSLRLLDLAPTQLRPALRSILNTLQERRRRVVRRNIDVSLGEEVLTVDVVADPIDAHETMFVFRETGRQTSDEDDLDADIGDFRTEERIQELENELTETRSTLRTTVEELETSNEELKSSNEEMMSMNEELQSANEELSTVNEELKSKLDELAQANADQANFLESTRIATVFVDSHARVRSFTPVARKLFRFADRDKGRSLLDVSTQIDTDLLREAIDRSLAGEEETSIQIEVQDEVYNFRSLPYRENEGQISGAVLVFEDVTSLMQSKRKATASERDALASRHEIERLYASAPIGMAMVDRDLRYVRINESLADYNGVSAEDHIGRTITEVLPDIGPRLDEVLTQVFETGEGVAHWELVAPAPQDPSQEEIFELDIYPLDDRDGRVVQVGIIVHRVTEARRLEKEARHLMAELQHRVKNSLATVVSIVRQTARNTQDHSSLAEALTRRIDALAATHSLLTAADWGAVPIGKIVEQELAPFLHMGDRIEIEGADVGVGAKAAVTLTLVLHELATNAAKYGALGSDDGRLAIRISTDADELRFEWLESGIEDVREPDRSGFGLKFISRVVAHDLQGDAQLTWNSDGLNCVVTMPLAHIDLGVDHG